MGHGQEHYDRESRGHGHHPVSLKDIHCEPVTLLDTRNTHTHKSRPSTVPWGSRIGQKSGKTNQVPGGGGGISQGQQSGRTSQGQWAAVETCRLSGDWPFQEVGGEIVAWVSLGRSQGSSTLKGGDRKAWAGGVGGEALVQC